MKNENRISELERRVIPPGAFMVVWEDPDKEGVYYDHPPRSQKHLTLNDDDLEDFRANNPKGILFVVKRDKMKHERE